MTETGPAVLIVGGTGMLGHTCLGHFRRQSGWRVAATQRTDRSEPYFLDVRDGTQALYTIFAAGGFDFVINCTGILKGAIREGESASVSEAVRINAVFPHDLASIAGQFGARVFHISTDGVFRGGSACAYLETSPPDAVDVYGKSKWLGECPAQNVLNLRCSIIGRDRRRGRGLVEWFLRTAEHEVVYGYEDEIWNGVSTLQFAELCRVVISESRFSDLRQESGVYHFCPNPAISKYELLCMLARASGRSTRVEPRPAPNGPFTRLLDSCRTGLRPLYRSPGDWSQIINNLLAQENSNT